MAYPNFEKRKSNCAKKYYKRIKLKKIKELKFKTEKHDCEFF